MSYTQRPHVAHSKPTLPAMQRKYDRANLDAAEVILQDVKKYGGESAGVVLWARAFLRRYRDQRQSAPEAIKGGQLGFGL